MKKIPTLFERIYENHKIVGITNKVTPGFEWVLTGEGIATIKRDGSCCAIIDGEFYKRYDAKKGRKPPVGAIPCCDPDPITGHWPHWVKCDRSNPSDKWFWKAYDRTVAEFGSEYLIGHTYEAIGKHFQGNPYEFDHDRLRRHGQETVIVGRSFESIKDWLETHDHEGIVFWKDGEPQCKIKRSDFGLDWPVRKEK